MTLSLAERSRRAVWHPCTQMKRFETEPLPAIVTGQGAWLVDEDGRRYLDAISSWWVNLFGHGQPDIAAAIADQARRLEHVIFANFTHPPAVALAETLMARTGLGHVSLASDGSSAVEMAIKMSVHAWRNRGQPEKQRICALRHGYHGETSGALSVTDVDIFRSHYTPLLFASVVLPSPDQNAGPDPEAAADAAADALDAHLERHAGETAAIIVEPLVQCAGGMRMHHPRYLQRLRAACDRHRVHFIADEIAVGFGRTGSFLACDQAGVRPDILCLSKGITGGFLPLSVTLTTDDIFAAFWDDSIHRAFLHSHSYTGNPIACRAALATLQLFEEHDTLQRNRATATALNRRLAGLRDHPAVANFRHTGMIWAFEVQSDHPRFSSAFAAAAMARGLLLRPLGNTVYLMPPYILDDDELDLLAEGCLGLVEAFA